MIPKLEVIKNPIGQLKVDGEEKDVFEISFMIKKGNNVIVLTPYEMEHLYKEVTPYIGKETITE